MREPKTRAGSRPSVAVADVSAASAAAHAPGTPHGRRVLVADDNQDAASSMTMMLRLMGHEVFTAFDGQEAVELAAVQKPEAILLDIGMPRLNGLDAAKEIREQPWGRSILLIAVTGLSADEDKARSKAAGFDYHLVKPASPAFLEQLLGGPGRN